MSHSLLRVETALGLSWGLLTMAFPVGERVSEGLATPPVVSFLPQGHQFCPYSQQPPTPYPPQTLLVVGWAMALAPPKTTGKANKLSHVCPQLFHCSATAI